MVYLEGSVRVYTLLLERHGVSEISKVIDPIKVAFSDRNVRKEHIILLYVIIGMIPTSLMYKNFFQMQSSSLEG